MRAVILAGGKGTRLRPYTTLIPKPLVPLGGEYSILEIVLMQLSQAGFTHVTLAVNHLSNLIMAYFGDGSRWGLSLDYSLEEQPLSTIGPLTLVEDLPEDFLVMNGDILCDLDYGQFFREHVERQSEVSVSVFRRDVDVDFGVLNFDTEHALTSFEEKPSYSFHVSMGIYMLSRRVIEELPAAEPYGFDNLMLDRLRQERQVWVRQFDGFWLDIGRPDDYQSADENFAEIKAQLGLKDS
jgi:NDP-sugar pyrophosphorylase family protein